MPDSAHCYTPSWCKCPDEPICQLCKQGRCPVEERCPAHCACGCTGCGADDREWTVPPDQRPACPFDGEPCKSWTCLLDVCVDAKETAVLAANYPAHLSERGWEEA